MVMWKCELRGRGGQRRKLRQQPIQVQDGEMGSAEVNILGMHADDNNQQSNGDEAVDLQRFKCDLLWRRLHKCRSILFRGFVEMGKSSEVQP